MSADFDSIIADLAKITADMERAAENVRAARELIESRPQPERTWASTVENLTKYPANGVSIAPPGME